MVTLDKLLATFFDFTLLKALDLSLSSLQLVGYIDLFFARLAHAFFVGLTPLSSLA
jgi:hypothetical protein